MKNVNLLRLVVREDGEAPQIETLLDYLAMIGYRATGQEPWTTFERGSSVARVYALSPRQIKASLSVQPIYEADDLTGVTLNLNVNAGQPLLKREAEFWEKELDAMEAALCYGYLNPIVSDYAASRALWFNLSILLIGLLVLALIIAIPTVIVPVVS